jgi:hypothetical protein
MNKNNECCSGGEGITAANMCMTSTRERITLRLL